jgi:hypothetical protein
MNYNGQETLTRGGMASAGIRARDIEDRENARWQEVTRGIHKEVAETIDIEGHNTIRTSGGWIGGPKRRSPRDTESHNTVKRRKPHQEYTRPTWVKSLKVTYDQEEERNQPG